MAKLWLICGLFVATLASAQHVEKDTWVSQYLEQGGSLEHVTGLLKPLNWRSATTWDNIKPQVSLPEKFNWNDTVKLQSIRNQGNCGSCWMFSVTAVVESLHRLAFPDYEPEIDLAEQAGVSCSGHGSCSGGYFSAFNYARDKGIPAEEDFPYQARNLRCKSGLKPKAKIVSWSYVGQSRRSPTTEQIKQAIYDHGPVSVDVNGSFSRYGGGVYTACGGTGTNHMVTIEGWVDDAQYAVYGGGYWIMRNSWGKSWGEAGYMRIVYNRKNSSTKCNGIGQITAYAKLEGVPNLREHVSQTLKVMED